MSPTARCLHKAASVATGHSPPLTDPSRFKIHQFATAGRASTSATPSAARGASPEGFLLIWPAMGLDARFSAAWFHPVPTPHIPHRRRTGCAQRPCLENPNMVTHGLRLARA
jgi:hypothetical protein